jgi:hypothetical protein
MENLREQIKLYLNNERKLDSSLKTAKLTEAEMVAIEKIVGLLKKARDGEEGNKRLLLRKAIIQAIRLEDCQEI